MKQETTNNDRRVMGPGSCAAGSLSSGEDFSASTGPGLPSALMRRAGRVLAEATQKLHAAGGAGAAGEAAWRRYGLAWQRADRLMGLRDQWAVIRDQRRGEEDGGRDARATLATSEGAVAPGKEAA